MSVKNCFFIYHLSFLKGNLLKSQDTENRSRSGPHTSKNRHIVSTWDIILLLAFK